MTLKREEFVDSRHGSRVRALQANLAPARQGVGRVVDAGPESCHHWGTRNLSVVDEAWDGEVASTKGLGNGLHVSPDLRHAGRVGGIPL